MNTWLIDIEEDICLNMSAIDSAVIKRQHQGQSDPISNSIIR